MPFPPQTLRHRQREFLTRELLADGTSLGHISISWRVRLVIGMAEECRRKASGTAEVSNSPSRMSQWPGEPESKDSLRELTPVDAEIVTLTSLTYRHTTAKDDHSELPALMGRLTSSSFRVASTSGGSESHARPSPSPTTFLRFDIEQSVLSPLHLEPAHNLTLLLIAQLRPLFPQSPLIFGYNSLSSTLKGVAATVSSNLDNNDGTLSIRDSETVSIARGG